MRFEHNGSLYWFIAVFGAIGIYNAIQTSTQDQLLKEQKQQVITELAPLVARFDGKPGMSVDDETEFKRRFGIQPYHAKPPYFFHNAKDMPFCFYDYETSTLDSALNLYKKDASVNSWPPIALPSVQ